MFTGLEDKIYTWLEKYSEGRPLKELTDAQYDIMLSSLEVHVAGDIGGNLDPSDVICPIVDRLISV